MLGGRVERFSPQRNFVTHGLGYRTGTFLGPEP